MEGIDETRSSARSNGRRQLLHRTDSSCPVSGADPARSVAAKARDVPAVEKAGRPSAGVRANTCRVLAVLPLALALDACGGGGSAGDASATLYSIGGTVTGLVTGQKVTLQNRGADSLSIDYDGAFTFPTQVAGGSSYDVTVSAQPNGGTCSIANGSGTNLRANVTGVTVTCVVSSFRVGGNLVGLGMGQQITLENNGGDPITLTADGPFSFPTALTFGTAYSVTIRTQPAAVSLQYCNVRNGSGLLPGAVTDVQVACNTEVVLHGFSAAQGTTSDGPSGPLIADGSGNWFGVSQSGGSRVGTVYQLSPVAGGGYAESEPFAFPSATLISGMQPTGSLLRDGAGNLYGATTFGGSGGWGVIYKLTPSAGGGYSESILYSFSGGTGDGGEPNGGLVMDNGGNLYGTTAVGGSFQQGIVFKLTPYGSDTYTMSILYNFTGFADGGNPSDGVVIDSAGNLYGTSVSTQGVFGGAVFKLSPGANGAYTETNLHVFRGDVADGNGPVGGLVLDSSGMLYGTTKWGSYPGGGGAGTVFRISTSGTNYAILHSFMTSSEGFNPLGRVLLDSAGNIYGTASTGGNANCVNGCGTIFKLSPSVGGLYDSTTLFQFSGGNGGAAPSWALVLDSAGNLIGTTPNTGGIIATNGATAGGVFEIIVH
jgi:uncharacterized repeat protein (TIGR03803 family)